MSDTIVVHHPNKTIKGSITLSGSKSISNRALLINALSESPVVIGGLSDSDDTVTLSRLLAAPHGTLDTGHAGTTYRFMTAYLAISAGEQVLTGSDRMLQRPIGPLVDALRSIGASIDYLGTEGYPPLRIGNYDTTRYRRELTIAADISSQYISALMMIAPKMPAGLRIILAGDIVSRPYLEMTLRIMQDFGCVYRWVDDQTVDIPSQAYITEKYNVEADWSAASYYYSIAAIADEADIYLGGLTDQQLQGDHKMSHIAAQLGVETTYTTDGIRITKARDSDHKAMLEYSFIECPDIAQSVMAMCGAMGVAGLYSGLQTLRIKETDRIAAMQTELAKVQVYLSKLPARFSKKSKGEYYMQEGRAILEEPTFDTYHDHRMAMALAPLAILSPVTINDPGVVSKSYPTFWDDLQKLGFITKPYNYD